ncbi:MAG: NADH-quinone oxidoreductase subunit M [Fibromonadaceae bacterium]|jgi:NADH-quinone oxidoreductase subunit M|nr:NADH-quinone oxidoreductase subunit M [Fibromonadaceae bacterium]
MSAILNLIWFLPILTVFVSLIIPRQQKQTLRMFHAISALANLVLCVFFTVKIYGLALSSGLPVGNALQLHYLTDVSWLPVLDIRFIIGADALSILMCVLAAIIVFTGILMSWEVERPKEFFALIQILGAGVFGVFLSFDLFLFMIFYEIEALAMYLMIAGWGTGRKDYSGKKLTLALALGSTFALIAVIAMYFEGGIGSWDIRKLADVHFSNGFQMWAFPFLFIGFAVSGSLFPFHNWSPDGHSSAPTAVSMFAAGVMMKMGCYGCLRIAMYLMPEGARFWLPYIVLLVLFNVVAAAFIAIKQRDLKYIIAYSSIAHLGLIFLGLCAANLISIKGASLQMLSHGFLTGMFFACVGMIYSRTHTRMVDEMGGLMKVIPLIGVAFVVAGFTGLGLPGLSGFAAELPVFMGSLRASSIAVQIVAVLAILSITTTAVYVLQATNKMLSGPLNPKFASLPKVSVPEKIVLGIYFICLFGMGLFPGWISRFLDTSLLPVFFNMSR